MSDVPPSPYAVPSMPPPVPYAPPLLSSEERMWAMFGHLSAFAVLLLPGIGQVIGPLIVWQVKKDTMPFAAQEAREAFNFNLTWLIGTCVAIAVTVVLCFLFVGFLLLPLVGLIPVVGWIFTVIAALRANDGQAYRYPLTIRFAT